MNGLGAVWSCCPLAGSVGFAALDMGLEIGGGDRPRRRGMLLRDRTFGGDWVGGSGGSRVGFGGDGAGEATIVSERLWGGATSFFSAGMGCSSGGDCVVCLTCMPSGLGALPGVPVSTIEVPLGGRGDGISDDAALDDTAGGGMVGEGKSEARGRPALGTGGKGPVGGGVSEARFGTRRSGIGGSAVEGGG